MTYEHILLSRDGAVATLTMNRPEKRNALSEAHMVELIDALRVIGGESGTRAVILAANGPAFCAGHDLRELVGRDLIAYRRVFERCVELMTAVQSIPQPVIAQVHAVATAAGCQLVATCDLALASEAATFATPGVNIGLFCTTPMVAVTRAIGRKRAMEMLLTGAAIDAHTAADWGLVNRVVAADALAAETQVAAYVSPPYAQEARLILKVSLNLGANLALMKHGLAHGARTVETALAAEREALVGDLGLDPAGFDFPTNGSGSPDSRATPRATVNLLAAMAASPVAAPYRAALPILGVDGSLAGTGTTLPARGHVLAKTGTTLGEGQLVAQNLAGYIDAKSGRRLAFALFLNDAGPVQAIEDVTDVFEDEAVVTSAFWEAF